MSFEDFYKLKFKSVYGYFYNKYVNSSDIEDLAQEAFLRLYQKYGDEIPDIDDSSKILFGICKNIYRDWVKMQCKKTNVDDIDKVAFVQATQLSEEDDYFEQNMFDKQREEKQAKIKVAMEKLGPSVKGVIVCRFVEGLTRKETAVKLGITEEIVHTYQKRGIKYLNKILNS